MLGELTDGDLRELGVSALGHRKLLIKAIERSVPCWRLSRRSNNSGPRNRRDGSRKCDVLPTGDPSDRVVRVVDEMFASEKPLLDRAASVHKSPVASFGNAMIRPKVTMAANANGNAPL